MEPGTETWRNSYGLEKRGHQRDLQEDHRTGDREASSRDFQRVVENQELDLVEWSPPSETEEEPSSTTSNASVRGKKKTFG
jgi:hypothetical protein